MPVKRGHICLVLALGAFVAPAFAHANVVVTKADAGKAVSVTVGTPFIVKLADGRTSGFWRLDSDTTPQLILSDRTTVLVKAPRAPDTTTFLFTPAMPGTVRVKARYVEAANGPVTPQNSFAVQVTVLEPKP